MSFTLEEIEKAMQSVKTGKAIGWDAIPDDILKEIYYLSLKCALKEIFEEIINSGKFPKID